MREKFLLYKTDTSFDYGDFDYQCEDEHGIELDIDGYKAKLETLDGFGNFTYLTKKYTHKTLANEIKSHLEDVRLYKEIMAVTYINEHGLDILLKILESEAL